MNYDKALVEKFETWWKEEGQYILTNDTYCKDLLYQACRTAWLNGAYVQEELNEL